MIDFKRLAGMSREEREEWKQNDEKRRIIAAVEKTEERNKFIKLLEEIRNSPRLTKWEVEFIATLLTGAKHLGTYDVVEDLSEKQREVFKRIEKKVFAIG